MKCFIARFPNERTVHLAFGASVSREGEVLLRNEDILTFPERDLAGAVVVKIFGDEMFDCIFKLSFFMDDIPALEEQIRNAVAFGFQTPNAIAVCEQKKAEGGTAFGVPDSVSAYIEPLLWECVTLGMTLRSTRIGIVN